MPTTAVVTDADELLRAHEKVSYPFFVKGVFYGATLVHGLEEAMAAPTTRWWPSGACR